MIETPAFFYCYETPGSANILCHEFNRIDPVAMRSLRLVFSSKNTYYTLDFLSRINEVKTD
jgi:hypothetical protein